jgi:mono/diheme cytochrome c family protein
MNAISKILILFMLATAPSWAADAKAGQPLYEKSCRSCHGIDGAPSAAVAKMMKVEMKDLRDPAVQALSNDAIKKIIVEGQGKMKPVAGISGAAAENVGAYVKTLKK